MDSKSNQLQPWQFDIIKRLPASRETIEKILREEFSVDFDGNPLQDRKFVNISRKKRNINQDSIEEEVEEKQQEDPSKSLSESCIKNLGIKSEETGEKTCLSMELDQ